MPPIKSINEPKTTGRMEWGAPPILTQAVPEPPKPTTTLFTADRIVGMILWQDRLYVATENGVYVNEGDGFFKRLKFQIVEETSE